MALMEDKKTDVEEFDGEECEECEEEKESSIHSDVELAIDVGRIDLSFPETTVEFEGSPNCYPPSYYTLSQKERVLLLYAENFRKQFYFRYPTRRPLVLAVRNECNVQKFVCTTIRPAAFLHTPLIGSIEGISSFVADFIIYEPPQNAAQFPQRLTSPATLLRTRHGNSFEMATLLASMLIGAGFPALVVSGVARTATVRNDQRETPMPAHLLLEPDSGETAATNQQTDSEQYKLRPMPDLESHLEENIKELKQRKEDEERRKREAEQRQRDLIAELKPVDRYHYRRYHAWVVFIDNAPWSIKPRKTYVDEDGEVVEEPPRATFIEPSTGMTCELDCKQYVLLDSVWNQYNYYVNLQNYQRVGEIRWDLRNTSDWEHLLVGEPPEMRVVRAASDENLAESAQCVDVEKHLDTIRSWVLRPRIGLKEFDSRFPKLQHTIHYDRTLYERYSPYTQADGKVTQVTFFSDDHYKEAITRTEYFKNRDDLLQKIKLTIGAQQREVFFDKGRNDCLQYISYNLAEGGSTLFQFYSKPRVDSLRTLEMQSDRIILIYDERPDFCSYQEFEFKPHGRILKKIVEKFRRNTKDNVPASKDIAVRSFLLAQRQIHLKFHYARGALTSSTLEFTKPPRPDYGKEIIYDPNLTKAYKADSEEPDATPLALYRLLLAQLKAEEAAKRRFERVQQEIKDILELRQKELENPVLKFNIFDQLRNGAAHALRLKQLAAEEARNREVASKPADFLAPYLVAYKNQKFSHEESVQIYHTCLDDLKTRYVVLLNDLQRQYEDLTLESISLKRFLNKFENQFSTHDYEKLIKESNDLELNKRMVQQRLTLTHETSQKKYEMVKESLLHDPRLNLKHAHLLKR